MLGSKSGFLTTALRLSQGAVVVSGCMLLVACLGKDKPAKLDQSQVAAEVNGTEISIHQVQTVLQMQPQLANQLGEAAPGRVLDSLVEQELAAQAARAAGLDNAPKVIQAMELAKREVLARAYQDMLADKVAIPDSKSIDAYYEAHPELFAHRRQYTVQEMQVKGSPEQVAELVAKVEQLNGTPAVNAAVAQSGLPHTARVVVHWAEALPMDILPKLAKLENGQSLGVAAPGGVLLMTVLASQEVPVTRATAEKPIKTALMSAQRQELVQKGMADLRQKATITRKGGFAAASAASGAGPSSPSAPAP